MACLPFGEAVSGCCKTQVNVAGTAGDIYFVLICALLVTHLGVAPLLHTIFGGGAWTFTQGQQRTCEHFKAEIKTGLTYAQL